MKLKAIFDHPKNSWRGPMQVVWYQGGLKPNTPRGYIDISRVGNGAIFEGTKGSIFADFTSRIILPNNDDGDFTYYKRRGVRGPAAGRRHGTADPDGGRRRRTRRTRRPGWRRRTRSGRPGGRGAAPAGGLPGGMQRMPSAEVTATGFPEVQMMANGLPPAVGLPNTARPAGATGGDLFQQDWLDACKGKSDKVVHGTSSKTHCDFDYSGTMIEQMLLGLVAHRAGKRLDYACEGRSYHAEEPTSG